MSTKSHYQQNVNAELEYDQFCCFKKKRVKLNKNNNISVLPIMIYSKICGDTYL